MSSRKEHWLVLGVCLVMAGMQIVLATRQCLWADEIFSLAIATGHSLEQPAAAARPELGDFVEPDHPVSAEEFSRYVKHQRPLESPARVVRAVLLSDTSPPLYYLLLYVWTFVFGTSDVALRLFSVSCSVACLPLLAGIAWRTGGSRAVLPCCVLFIFSPLAIYYSTEGRMYSLLLFLVLTTGWSSLVLQQEGGKIGLYLLWSIASAAGFLTHYFFVFPWFAMLVFLIAQPGKSKRRWLAGCVLVTAVTILPWYWKVPESFTHWRVTQDWLKWRPAGFHRLHALRTEFLQFFSGAGSGLWADSRWLKCAALALFAVTAAVAVRRHGWRVFSGARLLLWLWFFAACIAPFILDFVQHTYVANVPRYVLAALPAAYLLAGIGIGCLSAPIRTTIVALIVLAWSVPLIHIYRQHSRSWEPFRQVAQEVSTDKGAGPILVHSIPSGVLGIARYANGSANIDSWVGQLGTRRLPESLLPVIAGQRQISLVKLHEVGEPAPEEDWLRAHGQVLEEKSLQAATTIRFAPKDTATF